MPIQGPCAEASPRQRDAQARLARGPRTSHGSGPNLSGDDIQQFSIGGALILVVSRWSGCFRRPSRPLFVACVPRLRPAAHHACLSASNFFFKLSYFLFRCNARAYFLVDNNTKIYYDKCIYYENIFHENSKNIILLLYMFIFIYI
jgi:hypothetical protein